jgi:Icc-related predicted phosphoesterase
MQIEYGEKLSEDQDIQNDNGISNFTIYHFTDLHININYVAQHKILFKKIIDYININIDSNTTDYLIIFTGDIFDRNVKCNSCTAVLEEFIDDIIEVLKSKNVSIVMSVGNHDMNAFIKNNASRSKDVCTFLENLKLNTNQIIKDKMAECNKHNNCVCYDIVSSYNWKNEENKILEKVYYGDTEFIQYLLENTEDCQIFKTKSNFRNHAINYVKEAKEKMNRENMISYFNDDNTIIKEFIPISTYENYSELFKKLIEKTLPYSNVNFMTFIDGLEHTQGYSTIKIGDIQIGIINLNTAWMSTMGDHLNLNNLYISNVEKNINSYDVNKSNYNILIFHHPLEYISNDCNESLSFLLDNIDIKNDRNRAINKQLFNIGFCGHIHEYSNNSGDKQSTIDATVVEYKYLEKYNLFMPGALIPKYKNKNIDTGFLEMNKFIVEPKPFNLNENSDFELGNYFENIAFIESKISIRGTQIDENNNKIVLTKYG